MTRRSAQLLRVISVLALVVNIAVLVIVGVLFGWRMSVAAVAFYALWALRMHHGTAASRDGFVRRSSSIVFALIGLAAGRLRVRSARRHLRICCRLRFAAR